MRKAIFAVLLSSLVLLLTAQAASAQTVKCTGVFTGATAGNLEIPRDSSCFILNAVIGGNVSALSGSRFRMYNTEVGGNVSGVENHGVVISRSTVSGNIELHDGAGVGVRICGTTLPNGNIDIADWQGRIDLGGELCEAGWLGSGNRFVSAHIRRNVSGGSMFIGSNTYSQELRIVENTAGAMRVWFNTGNVLHCARNATLVFTGGPNAVAKREPPPPEGQCF